MYKCTNCGKEFEGNFCPKCGTKTEKEFSPPPDEFLYPAEETATAQASLEKPAESAPKRVLPQLDRETRMKLRTVVKLERAEKWIAVSIPLWAMFLPLLLFVWGTISASDQATTLGLVVGIVGSIAIILAFVSLLFGLVLLYRKKITFRKKHPVQLQKILGRGRILLIVSAAVSFIVSVIATVIIGLISKDMLVSLEMDVKYNYILPSLFYALPLGILALCCLFNAAICAIAQNTCRTLTKDQNIVRYYTASIDEVAAVLNSVPVTKRARRGQQLCWLSMGLALVISLVVVFPVANTNIFRISKLDKLPLGASQYKVAKLLGTVDYEDNNTWEYYSENFMSLYRRQKAIEEQYIEALWNGELDKIAKLDEQNKKLAKEAEGTSYRRIQILFDAEGAVFRVEMSYEYIPREGEEQRTYPKSEVKATIMPISVPYKMLSDIRLSYRYADEYRDSYVHALLTNPTWDKTPEGAGTYSLTWEDTLYQYSGKIDLT